MTNRERFLAGHKFKSPVYRNMVFEYDNLISSQSLETNWLLWVYKEFPDDDTKEYFAQVEEPKKYRIRISTYFYNKKVFASILFDDIQFVEPLTPSGNDK